jgi:oxalate decarboxylase
MNEHASVIDRPSIQPMRGTEGSPIIGPTNPAREAQNLDRLAPPRTDHGTLPNLKWSFADCHNKLEEGGWARQTTVREMPIATALACVNMPWRRARCGRCTGTKRPSGAS